MSNQDSTQQPRARKRVYQIPKEYKDASRLLYWAFVYVRRGASTDKYKITLAGNAKASIRNRITRMCKLAGCECTGRTRDDFETAIKTARRRAEEEGFDPAPVYAHARHIGERLERAAAEAGGEKPTAKAEPRRVEIGETDRRFVDFGALPGDVLTLTPLVGDPARGETIAAHWAEQNGWELAAFSHYEEDTENGWGRCPRFEEHDGQTFLYDPAAYDFYRIVSVTRKKQSGATPIDHTAKIEELRRRLDGIDENDITDSTARFRVEKQIYDLERQQRAGERAEHAEEWPEVIGEEGGAAMRHADLAEVTPRFKPGDLAYIVGPAGADAEPWGPFGVKKVEDMTGYYGWEPGSQLVHLEGVPVAEGEIDGCAVYLQIWAWPDSHLRHAEDAGSDTEEWPDFLPDEEGGAE